MSIDASKFQSAFDNLMALEGGKTTDHAEATNNVANAINRLPCHAFRHDDIERLMGVASNSGKGAGS